ncbi:MAG: hypothetical protein AAGE76_02895 [Pseudomonadota bacterium]
MGIDDRHADRPQTRLQIANSRFEPSLVRGIGGAICDVAAKSGESLRPFAQPFFA